MTSHSKRKDLMSQPLTDKQKRFANLIVQNVGRYSNTECAVQAGYEASSAYQRAYELLSPKISPHVVQYIGKIREDFFKKNQIDPQSHISRLHHLGLKAEEHKMFGVAARIEELRGKVAGYYVERVISKNSIDDLNTEEIEKKIKQILNDYSDVIEEEKK